MVKGKVFVVDVKERRARDIWKNQSRERARSTERGRAWESREGF